MSQLQVSVCTVGHLNFSSTVELFTRPLSHTVTWGLHRRWHVHEDPRHSCRQSVLRGSTSDPERAAISVTTRLADLGSCTDCQQCPLLQLGSCWYPRPAARLAAVRLECRRPFGFLSEAVRMHNPIASWAPLVESSGASHIPAVPSGLPLSSWNSAGVPCWEPAPGNASDVDTRRRLQSADSAMLVVPSTRRSTLGDCAFQVASARAWTACCRLSGMHRRWRRSVASWRLLFQSSFDNDYAIVIVLHSITVVCPRLLTVGDSVILVVFLLLVERPALAVQLYLCFRSVYFYFLSGNIFRTAEPISTKVCTVTATG